MEGDSSWPNAFKKDFGDLLNITNEGSVSHTYTVTLTEDSFTNPENANLVLVAEAPTAPNGSFSGLLMGSLLAADWAVYQAFADPSNAFNGMAVTSGPQTDSPGSPWTPKTAVSGVFSATSSYSLTSVFTVYLNGGDIFSADGVSPVATGAHTVHGRVRPHRAAAA